MADVPAISPEAGTGRAPSIEASMQAGSEGQSCSLGIMDTAQALLRKPEATRWDEGKWFNRDKEVQRVLGKRDTSETFVATCSSKGTDWF